jgi:uncharacterized membrane protein
MHLSGGDPGQHMDQVPSHIPSWAALSLVLLIAILLRFDILTTAPCLTADEAFSWRIAVEPDASTRLRMIIDDVHPPLYYYCLAIWLRGFGDNVFWLRGMSGLFGVLTVLAAYWYSKIWANDQAKPSTDGPALLSAALVALSVPQIVVAHATRMYALLTLLTVMAAGLLLAALRHPAARKWWYLYGGTATLLAYTHNYGLFFIAGQAAWLAFEVWRSQHLAHRRMLLLRAAGVFIAIACAYAPWFPSLRRQMNLVSAAYWIPPLKWSGFASLVSQQFSPPTNHFVAMPWYLILILVLLTVLAVWPWRGTAAERQLIAILVLHVVLVFGSRALMGRSVFVPRYLVHILPLCIVPVAYWMCQISDRFIRKTLIGWSLSVVAYTVVYTLVPALLPTERGRDFRRFVWTLESGSLPREPVIASDRQVFLVFDYYWRRRSGDQLYLLYDPAIIAAAGHHCTHASVIKPSELLDSVGDPRLAESRRCSVLSRMVSEWNPPGWKYIRGISTSSPLDIEGVNTDMSLCYFERE